MRRGEIWWTQQPKPIGRRPVVLLSRNEAYDVRTAISVAQITTTVRNIPVEVPLGKKDGLAQKCVVNLDTITTIRKAILLKRVCALRPEKIARINKAIRFSLGL